VGRHCGIFNIYVNDRLIGNQDLYTKHEGMTNPFIDLGLCKPENNAFVIRFELTGSNKRANPVKGKYALGLDFFLLEKE